MRHPDGQTDLASVPS
jgi:RNA polymerase sigma-70 factor (ECF subfamily)